MVVAFAKKVSANEDRVRCPHALLSAIYFWDSVSQWSRMGDGKLARVDRKREVLSFRPDFALRVFEVLCYFSASKLTCI